MQKSEKRCWQTSDDVILYASRREQDTWTRDMILENDTESRRTRRLRFSRIAVKTKTVNSLMSFEPEGKLQDSIQNQTREFDPGSGRTLAACLTHASRARRRSLLPNPSGGRVSNAWAICLLQGDNASKDVLIPRKTTAPHGAGVKGAIRFEMSSRPIS